MAFAYMHRYCRHLFIDEIQKLLNKHPYYGAGPITFQAEPVRVIEKYNFEARQFPIIVMDKTSFTEQPLDMSRKITDAYGHTRLATPSYTFAEKVWDDVKYTGAYLDGSHFLQFINVNMWNDEKMMVRKQSRWTEVLTLFSSPDPTTLPTSYIINNGSLTVEGGYILTVGVPASGHYAYTPGTNSITFGPNVSDSYVTIHYNTGMEFFEVKEDGIYTDMVPGANIAFGSFNSIRPGDCAYIDTFLKSRALGEIFGSRFKGNMSIKVYAQTQQQTEELVDMLHGFFLYILPQRVYYGHGINITKTDSSEVLDKSGEIGEEAFTGSLTIGLNIEATFFNPIDNIQSYELWLEFTDQQNYAPASPSTFLGRENFGSSITTH